jgi:hypothetical protein
MEERMINWREKFVAFAIHFVVTATLGACAAALIFLVWFPRPFATMIGGTELFLLVVGCDLALGPLVSLVVYDSRKSRRALLVDYGTIGVLQLAALVYGVYVVAGTRPVYVAFNGDRIEIVGARDISDEELAAARSPGYRSLPLTGPRLINVVVPPADHNDALFEALEGNEEHQRPKFYQPFESGIEAIRKHARTLAELEKKFPAYVPQLDAAMHAVQLPAQRVGWLPVHHREGFWTALIDTETGKPVRYVAVDPYG